jgi:hypothetical protein
MTSSVQLIEALGGGRDTTQFPSQKAAAAKKNVKTIDIETHAVGSKVHCDGRYTAPSISIQRGVTGLDLLSSNRKIVQ